MLTRICCIACLLLCFSLACQESHEEVLQEVENRNLKDAESSYLFKQKYHLFYADFFSARTPTDEPNRCQPPYAFFNNQEGDGKEMKFGHFDFKVTFCVDPTNFKYVDGEGTFFMEDGDELYFTSSGQVVPSNHPNYDFQFQDPFQFVGGTGKFEGASGHGFTYSLVKFLPGGGDRTDHIWVGALKLPHHNNSL